MTRRRGRISAEWETPESGNGFLWEHVAIEVLMDIRTELQTIRRLTECQNVQRGFVAMQSLDKHMKKRFPVKRIKKP